MVKRILAVVRILTIVSSILGPSAGYAITAADFNAINNDTPFYDPNDGCLASSSPTGTTGTASGSDNEQKIWNWLVGQGLTGAQAAGIMGNIEQESAFDPTIIQGGGNSNNPAAAGGGGWGLVQWTPGAKVLLDQKGAGATGNIYDIATELKIAWWEAEGNGQWAGQGNTNAKVKAVSGNTNSAAEQVASIWVNDFEHAGIVGPRGAFADQVLALAKKNNWTNANATTASGGSGAPASGGSTSAGSSASCCPATNAASQAGSFSSLSGDAAISGTFVLGFDASTNKNTIEQIFKKYKPAGMYILGTTNAAAAGFNQSFYQALALDAGHPIIASSDEEGLYRRYQYNFNFPSAGQMSTMSTAQVQAIGKQVGTAMSDNGLNVDLAPVIDVGTGNNSDFHSQPGRTFGDNANTVIAKAGAFAAGVNSAGVRPVYKHFPGLGSSYGNTDTQVVTSPALNQLTNDLLPFKSLGPNNGAAVMMDNAHIPGLTGSSAASTSAAAVSLLRNSDGFGGLIMTDDLIAASVGLAPDTAIAEALKAGVDAPLEKYVSNGVLDSAIAKAKAANVNTQPALSLLDSFVPRGNGPGGSGATLTNASCCPPSATATTAAGSGKYGALVGAGASFAGVDQGIDFVPSANGKAYNIIAPASGTITLADQTGHSFGRTTGQAEIIEQLDQKPTAPSSSQYVYYAEIIQLANGIKVGAHVDKGTVIGTNNQSPGIEVGWALSGKIGFMCPIGYPTPCGTSFNDWILGGGGGNTGGASGAQCNTTSAGGLTNPFPQGWQPTRLDMGYDGTFKNQIVAPFTGTIYYAGVAQGWDGTDMVVIHADANVGLPNNSRNIYFAEGVSPLVKYGQHVTAGTPIAKAVPNNYNGILGNIEWGVADANAQEGAQPNTEALVIGFPGTCSPSAASKASVLAFYTWAKKFVPGNATSQTCAGAN